MADISRTVEIIFSGINRTGNALQEISTDIDNVGRSASDAFGGIAAGADDIDKIVGPLGDVGKKLVAVQAGAVAVGAAFVTFATVQAGQFNTAFAEIATLIGEDPANLQQFKDDLEAYAATSTQSLETITGATYAAISAGIDYEDSLAALTEAEALSVAGKADLEGTLVALVSTLNAYGASTEEAGYYSDLLFTTVKEGQTTLPELQQSLSNVTSIAATAGVGFDEISAAIATLTAAGQPTTRAITGIQAAIATILKPTKEASDAADALGIEFNAAALESKGLAGILAEVADKTGGSTSEITKLFGGVEALKAVLPLTGTSADTFAEKLDAMAVSAGSTEEAFTIMSDNLDLQFQKLANSFNNILLNIGDPLVDEFSGIANAISAIFLSIGDELDDGALEELVKYVEDNLQQVQEVFERIAENLPEALDGADLSGFTDGIDAVKDAIGELFDDVDITTPEGLRTVIEGLGTAFNALGEFTAGFLGSFEAVVDFILNNSESVGGFADEFARTAGELSGFAEQASIVAGAVGGLAGALEVLVDILIVRAGANLVLGLGRTAAALGGSAGLVALLGPAGLVAAAGAAGYAVGTLIEEKFNLGEAIGGWVFELLHGKDTLEEMPVVYSQAGTSLDALRTNFVEAGVSAGSYADSLIEQAGILPEIADATDAAVVPLRDYSDLASRTADDVYDLTEAEKAAIRTKEEDAALQERRNAIANEYLDSMNGIVPIYDEVTGRITGFDASQRKANESVQTGINAIKDAEGNIIGYSDGIIGIKDSFKDADDALTKGGRTLEENAKSAEKAKDRALELRLELEQLASNERIRQIEVNAEINVAELEAQTARVEAAFESINETVVSTGDVISQLFGQLGEATGSERLAIQEQLRLENERRDEALDLQRQLTEAEIEYINAKVSRLQDGNALVEIDGSGLSPHIEAFMFEILEQIQVRVNQQGQEALLGL